MHKKAIAFLFFLCHFVSAEQQPHRGLLLGQILSVVIEAPAKLVLRLIYSPKRHKKVMQRKKNNVRTPDYHVPMGDNFRKEANGSCLNDTVLCWDYTNVTRNAELDCYFDKCPARNQCDDDVKRCPDGSYMIRNPWNECYFHECPAVQECPSDRYKCWDGTYVLRDPSDECRFKACAPYNYCEDEIKKCPGFKGQLIVRRNPLNNCEFYPCPPIDDNNQDDDADSGSNASSESSIENKEK